MASPLRSSPLRFLRVRGAWRAACSREGWVSAACGWGWVAARLDVRHVRVGCAVFSRGGLCVCSAAADPIGVAPLITAGKRSAPADKNYHTTPTPGGALHVGVVRAPGCVVEGCGGRLRGVVRGYACGLPAVTGSWTPMGSHYRVGSVRGFAFGSPAVIESSPPMGAQASRCGLGWHRTIHSRAYI